MCIRDSARVRAAEQAAAEQMQAAEAAAIAKARAAEEAAVAKAQAAKAAAAAKLLAAARAAEDEHKHAIAKVLAAEDELIALGNGARPFFQTVTGPSGSIATSGIKGPSGFIKF